MQQRQDTRAAWEAANPVLLKGEIGFLSDDLTHYKVGDGVTEWNRLPYRGSGSGGGSITIDTEMSDTSENAVQNKVIKAYVDDEAERVVAYAESVANDAEAAAKKYTDEKIQNSGGGGGEGVAELMVEITYDELVSLRDSNQLTPGMKYRIIDYETMTSQAETASAGHPFDIVVAALDENTLDERASAIWSKRDTDGYFANSNLAAWDVRYCLDNDAERFAWAVAPGSTIVVDLSDMGMSTIIGVKKGTFTYLGVVYVKWESTIEGETLYILTESATPSIGGTPILYIPAYDAGVAGGVILSVSVSEQKGKGVIYRLIDENHNDLPYDFKNILFTRKLADGVYDTENGVDILVYTFNYVIDATSRDYSLTYLCQLNIMALSSALPNNVFLNSAGYKCISNKFGTNCYGNTFGSECYDNTFADDCQYNTFADDCRYNKFGYKCSFNIFGGNCYSNTFAAECQYNNFSAGAFSRNTLGYGCENNTFGTSCIGNIFGDGFKENTLGSYAENNQFGNNCTSNTLRQSCSFNTFGHRCQVNVLGGGNEMNIFGDNCSSNTLGNQCLRNIFGISCTYDELGDSCISNVFGNNCSYIRLGSNMWENSFEDTAYVNLNAIESGNATIVAEYKLSHINGGYSNRLDISVERGRNYGTFVTTNKVGDVIEYTIDDLINA